MDILAVPALLGTYFGFAGALGEMIYRARASFPNRYLPGATLFAAAIFLPASLALPLPGWLRFLTWTCGLALTALFSVRPYGFPTWLWSPTFAYRYLTGTMTVITLWSLSQGPSPPVLGLGILAAVAGGMALIKWKATEMNRPHEARSNSTAS